MLVPAYVNIHVHGAVGHDVMEGTPQALHLVERLWPATEWAVITRQPLPHPSRKPYAPWR